MKSVKSVESVSQPLPSSKLAAAASILVPGLGQYLLGRRQRGLAIFFSAIGQAFLIWWSFDHLHVGKVTLGALTTSWLWLLLAMFWAWNVYDALGVAQGKPGSQTIPVLLTALVIYVIAWQVTNVRLDRLVTNRLFPSEAQARKLRFLRSFAMTSRVCRVIRFMTVIRALRRFRTPNASCEPSGDRSQKLPASVSSSSENGEPGCGTGAGQDAHTAAPGLRSMRVISSFRPSKGSTVENTSQFPSTSLNTPDAASTIALPSRCWGR